MRPLHGRRSGPTRRSTAGKWTAEEDELLCRAVQRFKGKSWKKIAECFKDRTDVQCLHRWQKVLNPELIKGPWSKEEDEKIIELVNLYGVKKWSTIAQALPGRIGKQCRERWHNHLNPAINKEAWTQEEELVLIHAHQIYGNKWAELSKFLPGRADNAIKNHWNSSVKKKLESYLASGLLAQFQGLPYVGNPNLTSLGGQQSSGDNIGQVGGIEGEETSECSQGSNSINFSHSSPDRDSLAANEKENFRRKRHNSEENLLHEAGNAGNKDFQFSSNEWPGTSFFDVLQESLGQSNTSGCRITSMGNILVDSADMDHPLRSHGDFSETQGCFPHRKVAKVSDTIDLNKGKSMLVHQSGFQSSANTESLAPESSVPMKSVSGKTFELEFITSLFDDFIDIDSPNGGADKTDYHLIDEANNAPKLVPVDVFSSALSESMQIFPSTSDDASQQLVLDEAKTGSKVTPMDLFSSVNSVSLQTLSSLDDNATVCTEKQDSRALIYEPHHFPSLDIPFLSCDFITSGSDMQQAYSPLGIRRLIMSSMNFSAPCSSEDSPIQEENSHAILVDAVKSFTSTPSIMKKRLCELLSPSEATKGDKRLERDTNVRLFCTSGVISDFSSLEAIFDGNETCTTPISSTEEAFHSPSYHPNVNAEAFMKDKTNMDHTFVEAKESFANLHSGISEKDIDIPDKINFGTASINAKAKHSGLNVQRKMDDLLICSPRRNGHQTNRAVNAVVLSPKCQYSRRLDTTPVKDGHLESSSGNQCFSVVVSPIVCKKYERLIDPVTSMECIPSPNLLETTSETNANGADSQSFGIFGETPVVKKGIESPSAWKSPWFMNSSLPGLRIDTDITLEDLGYFLSPGMRSFDAIGLTRQMSEHNADAFDNAREVLAINDPETLSKKKLGSDQSFSEEDNHFHHDEQENTLPGLSMERRVLDFVGCGTPGKGTESKRFPGSATTASFSTPSSYLMKGCR